MSCVAPCAGPLTRGESRRSRGARVVVVCVLAGLTPLASAPAQTALGAAAESRSQVGNTQDFISNRRGYAVRGFVERPWRPSLWWRVDGTYATGRYDRQTASGDLDVRQHGLEFSVSARQRLGDERRLAPYFIGGATVSVQLSCGSARDPDVMDDDACLRGTGMLVGWAVGAGTQLQVVERVRVFVESRLLASVTSARNASLLTLTAGLSR